MKTILCFGNEFLKKDSLAKEIADELKIKNVKFIKCDDLNNIFDYKDKDMYLLDVAEGIDNIKIFNDISKLKTKNITSLHDFDLGYFLRLMKEVGQITRINIIAIPVNYNKEKAKKELRKLL